MCGLLHLRMGVAKAMSKHEEEKIHYEVLNAILLSGQIVQDVAKIPLERNRQPDRLQWFNKMLSKHVGPNKRKSPNH